MKKHISGCILCSKELVYQNSDVAHQCQLCGESFKSNVCCIDSHFVCDACHAKEGIVHITSVALKTNSKDPVTIAEQMMDSPHVNMHGPEHHYLVAAALLAALHSVGQNFSLSKALAQARQRTRNVPGGICGMWGNCGAGVGTGIFISIVTQATPLSTQSWSLANLATSESLYKIAKNGGPRCCKRNTFLAVQQMVLFLKEHLDVNLSEADKIECKYNKNNKECRGKACLYFPA